MEQTRNGTIGRSETLDEPFDFERHWPRGRAIPNHGLLWLFIVLARHLWRQGKRRKAVAAFSVAAGLTTLGLGLGYLWLAWQFRT